MKQIIKKEGLPDVVFHSLRHTSVTYKLKLSGGDIKEVQLIKLINRELFFPFL